MGNKTAAYVDESMRTFDGETTYYLCAVVDRGMDEVAASRLRSLVPSAAARLGDVILAHMRGGDEPRLWVPDQILGAQGHVDAKGGADEDWALEWKRLEKRVERREIAL